MNSRDIRECFLQYFQDRGHRRVSSSPLVPHGDATLLFTNAGMVQFKDVFLGLERAESPRAASSQKCLRVSGKHNDLENVGPSPRHHTFFEMLGNFSFGDYFKDEAIQFGWELVTDVWGLPPEHLYATVFEEDDEAEALWRKISSLPHERILRCGAKDNFWAMGETGPCGPCSEIFVDLHPDRPQVDWEEGSESGRYLEIWNLVFMQFNRGEDGAMAPLPNPSIDTGAGLERLSAVLQGKTSNYDTDLFQPILMAAADLASLRYGATPSADISLRVIADHLRAVTFLLADGVIPASDGRGYVLRRILRRAIRHGMRLGFEEPFLYRLLPTLEGILGGAYPELGATQSSSTVTVRAEEEKFLETIALGARHVQEAIEEARHQGSRQLQSEAVFKLYDTFGLPLETIREIAEEEQFTLDEEGFQKALGGQRERSRAATGQKQKRLTSLQDLSYGVEATGFVGYRQLYLEGAKILRLAREEEGGMVETSELNAGEKGALVVDSTVFYAESGGQVGDRGSVTGEGVAATISDTQKDGSGVYFHLLEVQEGVLRAGAEVNLQVEEHTRRNTERNHTATHLLHAALRNRLGEGVRQAGSLVDPEHLRFDFTFTRPLSPEDVVAVEDEVMQWVLRSVPLGIQERSHEDAVSAGAMALFGEKYGDVVRTVEVPGFSLELCGGCHVASTGEIGPFEITSEKGVASGVRRIEALTGTGALALRRERQRLSEEIQNEVGTQGERIPHEIRSLKQRLKDQDREMADLRRQLVAGDQSSSEATEVRGIPVLAREVPSAPPDQLRELADTLRDRLGSGVVVLGCPRGEKVSLVVTVSKDLMTKVKAGNVVRDLAKMVGGGGGGRPDFAQAGGRFPEKLTEALAKAPEVVEALLDG